MPSAAAVGFNGGTLACTADCDLDVTQCVHETSTTGDSETSVTTVTTATDTPTGPGPATTGAESLTDEGGGEGGDDLTRRRM